MNPQWTFNGSPAGHAQTLKDRCLVWWQGLPSPLRDPKWPMVLSTLVIAALLTGFYQVVMGAVQQGEIMRTGAATRQEAIQRCGLLQSPQLRESCVHRLEPEQRHAAAAEPPPNTAVQVAQAGR